MIADVTQVNLSDDLTDPMISMLVDLSYRVLSEAEMSWLTFETEMCSDEPLVPWSSISWSEAYIGLQ
jgi:hypothetical protein